MSEHPITQSTDLDPPNLPDLPDRADRPPPALAPREARRKPTLLATLIGWLAVLASLGLLAGIAAALVILVGEYRYANYIYPNIRVQGVNLSLHTPEMARGTLERHYARFTRNPVTLIYAEQTWQPTAANLGLHLHYDQAVQQAALIGRGGTRADNLRTAAAVWRHGYTLPLHMEVDQAAIQHYVLALAPQIEQPPRNADLQLIGATLIITPEQVGVQLLVDETVQEITAALHSLKPQPVAIRTRTIYPVVRDAQIAEVAAQVQALFAAPIIATVPSDETYLCPPVRACTWQWTPSYFARWVGLLRTVSASGTPAFKLVVDRRAIERDLQPIAQAIYRPGELPRANWNNGELVVFREGTLSRGLDLVQAGYAIEAALRDGGATAQAGAPRVVYLPTTHLPPPIVQANIAKLGITELLGVGVSSFRASAPYRITNIRAGARRMHGLLIPPGTVFSFNSAVGAVDGRNGFVQGLAIIQNRTQTEWGGGLCQVSTTVFRAAFWAGMPIVERHEHNFRIPWYEELGEPPGMDAAIYTGWDDLRFVNDTDGYMLIQAWVDLERERLSVALYGQPQAKRQVRMGHEVIATVSAKAAPVYIDDPTMPAGVVRQTDWAQPGMTINVYRTVTQAGQVLLQDTFRTEFEPWSDVYLRGTR